MLPLIGVNNNRSAALLLAGFLRSLRKIPSRKHEKAKARKAALMRGFRWPSASDFVLSLSRVFVIHCGLALLCPQWL
jgi:hypothetical protein